MTAEYEMDFSTLSFVEIEVPIDNKLYILKEADGDAVCKYRNKMLDNTEIGGERGFSRMKGMADVEPMLIALCLREKETQKLVTTAIVRSWPNPVMKALFNKLKDISELDDPDDVIEDLEKRLVAAKKKKEDSKKD